MTRLTTTIVTVAVLLTLTAAAATATDAGRSIYAATGLDGHPELRTGAVLDVTFDRDRGALEHHRISGAAPDTTYALVATITFAPECSPLFGAVTVPEGLLVTDGGGNGSLTVRFPGDALAGAPDTFWVTWALLADGVSAYETGCLQVDLGSA